MNRRLIYSIATAIAFALVWQAMPAPMPTPAETARAFATLWQRGLFDELGTSIVLNLEAIAVSSAIALVLAYATVVPAMRPLATGLSKLRFSGLVGWSFVLAVLVGGGHELKLTLLVFGMTPFALTQMTAIVAAIPREQFDHARTLGLPAWRVACEVVVLGTADATLEAIRQNAAMGWMMLTMVEGLVRSEGGAGVMMLDANKHLQLDHVFALIATVLAVGVIQDYALGWLRRVLCPYAALVAERS